MTITADAERVMTGDDDTMVDELFPDQDCVDDS